MPQLIITAVGPDRPGLVGEITGHIHAAGANIVDSRMANLQGQFAVILLLEGGEGVLSSLRQTLPGKGSSLGLSLNLSEQAPAAKKVTGLPMRLRTWSMDQPGIVSRISRLLQKLEVNIEDLSARQESAPFAGGSLFLLEMRLTVPADLPVRTLRAELEKLCDSLNCDVDLEPA